MKQAASTVDQLCECPLNGIPAYCDYIVIVLVFTRNAHTQIKMGLPPVLPLLNPFIIEQSLETGMLGKIPVARHHVEAMVHTMTAIMTMNIRTTANPQQDVVIKSAETP